MSDTQEEPLLLPPRASAGRRAAALLAGVTLGVAAAVGGAVLYGRVGAGRPPAWPTQYEVTYTIAYPATLDTQKDMLVYTLVAYRDEPAGLQKVVRDGVETTLEVLGNNTMYHRCPRVDKYACEAAPIASGKGPTSARGVAAAAGTPAPPSSPLAALHALADPAPSLSPVLPDMTAGGWTAAPHATRADGSPAPAGARAFERRFAAEAGYGAYASSFTMWINATTGAPLLLEALAVNLWTGGHYDLTVTHFSGWRPGPPPRARLRVPHGCPAAPPPGGRTPPAVAKVGMLPTDWLASVLPNAHGGDGAYDAFLHRGARARRTRSEAEYAARAAAHAAAVTRVASHNAAAGTAASTYRLAVTALADLLPHERAGLLSQHPAAATDAAPSLPSPRPGDAFFDPPAVGGPPLPATVDWRGTPADSPVKDQAMCGSCWSFGTIGAVESAIYRATGKARLLSEQHLVDCAWSPTSYTGKYPNAGCGGGYQTTAFDWMFARGGAVGEAAYPYRGVNGFCDAKAQDAATFKGKYVWVRGGDDGLRAALLSKGVMTVSVDASADDFPLYRAGIYNNTRCEERLSRLDHAVLVSGYGREGGINYWIVKNTWSRLWGEDGYVRIAVRPDDCGISAQPLFLELEGVKMAE